MWSVTVGFSDGDLKRAKDLVYMAKQADGKISFGNWENFDALLARLETSEKVCELGNHSNRGENQWWIKFDDYYQAWRKSCGK